MKITVILSTYRWPRALALALRGYALQTWRPFEIVIADDGSGPETARVVEEAKHGLRLPIIHVWQEDDGFRKTEILNRAIVAASGDYLVFSDGDCIPRKDFLAQHWKLSEKGAFLSGGCLRLKPGLSGDLQDEDVETGRIFDSSWLRRQGWSGGHRRLRLTRSNLLASLLDGLTTTRPTWNGHNASTWKEAILQVNGFDLGMGYGSEDRILGERLRNLGLKGRQIRFRAPVVHLHHERPYRNIRVMRRNKRLRKRIRREGEVRSGIGLDQMPDPALDPRHESRSPLRRHDAPQIP